MTNTITTSRGTTVSLEEQDGVTLVVLRNAKAPTDLRRAEAGRVVDGGYQAPIIMPYALSPEVLRAIATLIDEK